MKIIWKKVKVKVEKKDGWQIESDETDCEKSDVSLEEGSTSVLDDEEDDTSEVFEEKICCLLCGKSNESLFLFWIQSFLSHKTTWIVFSNIVDIIVNITIC